MMKLVKPLTILLILITLNLSGQTTQVGFLVDPQNEDKEEIQAAFDFLNASDEKQVRKIPLDKLNWKTVKNLDQVWYHRPDSTSISDLETRAGKVLKKFVKKGGDLVLTLDAVRLLNSWGIEETPIGKKTEVIKDHGFGRKLGFHSFRSHPIFDGLHGGAYIWHGKEDHQVRKLGFFGSDLPQGPEGKVIGIDWAYITYHEDDKLLWEYTMGKGNLLAVGAYTYFSKENFNKDHLERFMINVFEYLGADQKTGNFWTYDLENPQIMPLFTGEGTDHKASEDWEVSSPGLKLGRPEATDNYWDLPGRRLLLMGKETGGFEELWAHPFMAFRDYRPGVRIGDSEEFTWLDSLKPEVEFSPGVMVRTYQLSEDTLMEITTVSAEGTEMIIHYQWSGSKPLSLFLSGTSNLRFMWPYSANSTGTLHYQWSEDLNALLVSDSKTESMNAMLGFNQHPQSRVIGHFEKVGLEQGQLIGQPTDKNQISAGFLFEVSDNKNLDVYISAGEPDRKKLVKNYRQVTLKPSELLKETIAHYEGIDQEVMKIVTPDSLFNEGFRWAMAGADQFMVETPGVGKSLVAGYGSTAKGWGGGHEISGRPGYAWYFGRDAQWSGFALNAYGNFQSVKEILETFNAFQNINGKIYHELTTSGSVHYDASDATPLYVLLASHYLKASGDIEFINDTWENLEKAMAYCYSTDTDGDGFIENTNVGHGWIEGGALFGAHTTFYLAGLWAATLREAAFLAENTGNVEKAQKYRSDYLQIREKLNSQFWNGEKEHFNYGLWKDGSYSEEITMLPAVPVYFNTVDKPKAVKSTEKYASGNFSTDWGVRILEEKSKHFNPGGYHVGSVWPLFTGWTALAEYETGRYPQGFSHLMNNLVIYKDWDLGSIEEVLNGVEYKSSGVTHNQGWSQTMVLQPILEGMLGIRPNALEDRLSLAPKLPWDWNRLTVNNIRFGTHSMNMEMDREEEQTVFSFNHEGNGNAKLTFEPVFPWGTEVHSVELNGKAVPFKSESGVGGLQLNISEFGVRQAEELVIKHTLGHGVLPLISKPEPGADSNGIRLIREEEQNGLYKLTVEGRPGSEHFLEIFSPDPPKNLTGATRISEKKKNVFIMKVSIPESQKNYEQVSITMDFR